MGFFLSIANFAERVMTSQISFFHLRVHNALEDEQRKAFGKALLSL